MGYVRFIWVYVDFIKILKRASGFISVRMNFYFYLYFLYMPALCPWRTQDFMIFCILHWECPWLIWCSISVTEPNTIGLSSNDYLNLVLMSNGKYWTNELHWVQLTPTVVSSSNELCIRQLYKSCLDQCFLSYIFPSVGKQTRVDKNFAYLIIVVFWSHRFLLDSQVESPYALVVLGKFVNSFIR
jgi:hypothetical protein